MASGADKNDVGTIGISESAPGDIPGEKFTSLPWDSCQAYMSFVTGSCTFQMVPSSKELHFRMGSFVEGTPSFVRARQIKSRAWCLGMLPAASLQENP